MRARSTLYATFFKPLMDRVGAFVSLIVCFPLLMLIMVINAIVHRGSPFFFQMRAGRAEKLFYLIKFRSYLKDGDGSSITSFGSFLRKTSLDELPQLLNILRGDMSFVGPRPLLVSYLTFYNEREKQRHLLKPGLTGLSQIKLGSTNDWEERLEQDVRYVESLSLMLDVRILLVTLFQVVIPSKRPSESRDLVPFDQYAENR
ncbi:MAG: sugar transferase [Ekhidna sp.]